jgi:hypothetical protein
MFANCFKLVFSLAYSLTVRTETTCTSETAADFQRTIQLYISEYHSREDLKPYNMNSELRIIGCLDFVHYPEL